MIYVQENNRILNWPVFPLLRVAILLIIGIFLGRYFSIPLIYQLSTALFLFITICILQKSGSSARTVTRWSSLLILFLIINIGFIRYSLQMTYNDNYHYTKLLNKSNYIVGQVVQDIKKKKASSSTLLEVESIDGKAARGKLLVYFNKKDSLLSYTLGDIISINGRVSEIQVSKNPKAFDYRSYLANKEIDRQVFLREGYHALVKKERLFIVIHYAFKARSWAISLLDKRLADRDEFATASAMVLGNRDHISDELQSAFSDTGAVHVLAVSGLHVGIVLMLFNFLFRRTRSESKQSKKVFKFIVLSVVVIAYALITGASPAVIRASIMFSTLLYGRLWFDNTNIYNILAFSAILILLYNPNYLTDLGFIFSYLALISIVFFQPYFMRLIERFYEPNSWLSIRTVQLITVSLAAQILIFPMSIHYFHKFPIYFILSGVFAVAMAPFILGLGLILIMTSIIPIWSDFITLILSLTIKLFLLIIYGIQSLPFNSVDNIWISQSSMIYLYIGILSIMHMLANKKSEYQKFLNSKNTSRNIAILILSLSVFGLLINSTIATYRIKNHNELILYDINGTTLLDIYNGENMYTLTSKNADLSKLKYACRDSRIYHGNLTPSKIYLDSTFQENSFVSNGNGIIKYGNKTIYFLANVDLSEKVADESDIIMITHGCSLTPYKILEYHKTNLVVIDGSVSYKMINQWKKECEKKAIPIYITKEKGAFVLPYEI